MKPFGEWLSAGPVSADIMNSDALEAAECGQDLLSLIASLEASIDMENEALIANRLATLRAAWEKQASSDYQQKLARSIDSVQARLIDSVSRALRPLLSDSLIEKGIEEFCDIIGRHLGTSVDQTIEVLAPAEMRERIERHFAARAINADVNVADGPEISTVIGATEIETDLHGWVGSLKKVAA